MKVLNLLLSMYLTMKITISVTLVLAVAFGLVLASIGNHSSSVLAQTNAPKKSTTQNATSSANKGSGGAKPSSTSPTTTTTVKGGPKAAGTASQLNQIEGNNTQTLSKNANIANKPGLAGLKGESNVTGK
jgi:cytoskeletal protein RodZ